MSTEDLSRMLHGLGAGGAQRAQDLLPLVYEELRSLARARMARERPGQTLQPTVLVHEAYLRVVGDEDPGWNGRAHFLGAAARAMRRILVEEARRKARLKHGDGRERAELEPDALALEPPGDDVLAVDEARRQLEATDERKGRIVELRWFAGLPSGETAAALGVSVGTVEREWRFIRAWLRNALDPAGGD
jgi:RNA polymerase sigma factor (TIGR02999 family)